MRERLEKVYDILNGLLNGKMYDKSTMNWIESELDDIFPFHEEIQDFITCLALYEPEGGELLFDIDGIKKEIRPVLEIIKNYK